MYTSVVSDIKNELNDWLDARGGDVADLALSLINQAINQLWNRRPWDVLCKNHTLVLTDNIAPIPSDFGRFVYVASDADNDGVVDWFYSQGHRDMWKRYDIETTLASNNQVTMQLKFPHTPQNTPILRYVVKINKVVNDTDYLFFPAPLVLRTAQKIRAIDKSISGLEVNAINNEWLELIRDFEDSNYHIDRTMQKTQQDQNFCMITNDGYTLDGGGVNYIPNRSPSEDIN